MFDNLLRTGLRPSEITHVFFSHLHSDHMMDYARLIHAAWDEGVAQIKVIGPKPIQFVTDGLFGPNGALSHDIRARTELKPSQQVWVARGNFAASLAISEHPGNQARVPVHGVRLDIAVLRSAACATCLCLCRIFARGGREEIRILRRCGAMRNPEGIGARRGCSASLVLSV